MVLAEVEGLLRALGLARQVRVLACDTAVAPAQRVSSARQVQLVGGGGTDMGAGIAAAAALRPRPAVTVVLTDGYTPWPAERAEGHADRGRAARRAGPGRAAVGPRRPGGTGLRRLVSWCWFAGPDSGRPVCLLAAGGDLLSGDEYQAKTADPDADRDRAHLRVGRDRRGQLHRLGGVFTSVMTGNIVLAGLAVARGR